MIVLQLVSEIMTKSYLASLTATLHGIPDVLKDSSRKSCVRWHREEDFAHTDPIHLRSVSRSSRMSSYSNEELFDFLTVYGNADCNGARHSVVVSGTLPEQACSTSHDPRPVGTEGYVRPIL
ncbi:hypothetical protein TNCV_5049851 [Trichonephila clavipes]|nr:hypothetical protein TNCV_5049851 [Trichonephila clavipes]